MLLYIIVCKVSIFYTKKAYDNTSWAWLRVSLCKWLLTQEMPLAHSVEVSGNSATTFCEEDYTWFYAQFMLHFEYFTNTLHTHTAKLHNAL